MNLTSERNSGGYTSKCFDARCQNTLRKMLTFAFLILPSRFRVLRFPQPMAMSSSTLVIYFCQAELGRPAGKSICEGLDGFSGHEVS